MSKQVFINVATSDLERAKRFYVALGCEVEPNYSDDNAACLVWSDHVYFMVLTREFFATFTDKALIDAKSSVQTLIALSLESREAVDRISALGLSAGGAEPRNGQDLGFMYSRDIEDPDGNILEFFYMDPVAAENGPPSSGG